MKKTLVALFTLFALAISVQTSQAACPCQTQIAPCPCMQADPCNCAPCGEAWLNQYAVEDYFCRIGLNDCQKAQAMNAIEKFKCETKCLRANGCKCESKCECREYKKALRNLDCDMKKIITSCQKQDYKCVKDEIKDKVQCAHKCLINPFHRCKCACGK